MVNYLAMRDLIKTGANDLFEVKKKAHSEGPFAQMLAKMNRKITGSKQGQTTIPNTPERYGRLFCSVNLALP